jgi:branched-chain amino acid transport system substrate-binding protein
MDRDDLTRCTNEEQHQKATGERAHVSRRDFLRLAAVSGAVVGLGSGLGGLIAGCGEAATTTTTSATGGSATTATTAGATTTTASAGTETGREIKVGLPSPYTGAYALFGVADQYCLERWKEVIGAGIVCGDGKKHPVSFISRDTQSDVNRVSQVTGDMIQNDKCDIITVASAPDTVLPAADQAEAQGTPFISVDCPMETFWTSRGKNPTKDVFAWTYNFFWTLEDQTRSFVAMWDKLTTNKVIGVMFPNDADGLADRQVWPPLLQELGYKMIDGGAYLDGTEDYTAPISMFKKEGCDLVVGDMIPPDFVNFWKQCIQQGFRPKIASILKALLFAESAEAAGPIAYGMTGDGIWVKDWPFSSSLTGETGEQLAADFEKRLNRQWMQPLGTHYVLGEWVIDVLKRCKNLDDKNVIMDAIKTTHIDTMMGPLYLDEPVKAGTAHEYENGYNSPFCVGQWIKGTGKYPFEFVTVGNATAPQIPVKAELQPISYPS